jgi:hypothetical protein
MKYLLECCNDSDVTMELSIESDSQFDFLAICLSDETESTVIHLDKNDVFDLIGILHHIQKKMK